MDENVYPNESLYYQQISEDRWRPVQIIEDLKPKARAEGLWNLFCRTTRTARPEQSGIRPTVRNHGPFADGVRSFQLLGARHRKYGSARALRHAGTKERWLKPLLAGEIRSASR